MKFSEFYGDVRTYFVSCTVEYDRFRMCDGIKQKLVFLLRNKKVDLTFIKSPLIKFILSPLHAIVLSL